MPDENVEGEAEGPDCDAGGDEPHSCRDVKIICRSNDKNYYVRQEEGDGPPGIDPTVVLFKEDLYKKTKEHVAAKKCD